MAITVRGILKSPQGLAIQNAELLFEQTRTTEEVLQGTKFSINTQPDGAYTSTLGVGIFTFKIRFQEEMDYRTIASNIIVSPAMDNYSINQIIQDQSQMQDIDYDLLQAVLQARDQTLEQQAQAGQSSEHASTHQLQAAQSAQQQQDSQTQSGQSQQQAYASQLQQGTSESKQNFSQQQQETQQSQAQSSSESAAGSSQQSLENKNQSKISQDQAQASSVQAQNQQAQASSSQAQAQIQEGHAQAQAEEASNSQDTATSAQALATTKASQAQSSATQAEQSQGISATQAEEQQQHQISATNSQSSATVAAQQALTSSDLQHQWAANEEGVEVQPGKYSALHYAAKAAQSAQTSAGQLIWRGGWSAQQGTTPPTPDLTQDFYRITEQGTILGVPYTVGDYIHWDTINSIWFKMDGPDSVVSVNGMTGVVLLDKQSIGLGNLNNWQASSQTDNPSTTTYATSAAVKAAFDLAGTKLGANATAVSATKLANKRAIGGVLFDGTQDISLPGVNSPGNQNTTGNQATASKLKTPVTFSFTGGVQGSTSFDGSQDINVQLEVLGQQHSHAITDVSGLSDQLSYRYSPSNKPTPAELGALQINTQNQLNNSSFGVGLVTSADGGRPWIGLYVGTATGDRVVSGTLQGVATIGGHNSGLTSWSDFYINTLKTGGNEYKTYVGNPYAKLVDGTAYEIYHKGNISANEINAANSNYLPVNTDLNSLYGKAWTGFFNVPGGSPNWPFGASGGSLLVSTHDQFTRQIAFAATAGTILQRRQEGTVGIWTAWSPIYSQEHKPTPSELGVVATGSAREDALNDAGIYTGAINTDFNSLGAGFCGLIVITGSTNYPPPCTWGDGHVYVEVQRILSGELVQRTLPFRGQETTASRTKNYDGTWTEWKVDMVSRHIGPGADLNNYWNTHNSGFFSVNGANTPNWPWNNVSAGTLIVDGIASYTRQQAWRADTFDTLVRFREGAGPWTAWQSVYNSSHFPKIATWANFAEVPNMVVGALAWKNYNNSHVILDISSGVAPAGQAVNNINAEMAWEPTFPMLVGWNGGNTCGVRVDSARLADKVKDNGISASGNGNAWSIVNGNIVEVGGFTGCSNSAPQRVNFPFRLATVFTVQITAYTEGSGRNSGAEANNVVDLIDNDGFTIFSGQGKSPCTFMWVAKGIKQ